MTNSPNENTEQKDGMAIALERIEEARRTQTTGLDLYGLDLTEVPEALCTLTQLQELDLSNNHLTRLPEAFRKLTQLKKLYLHGNQLRNVPEVLWNLTQLQILALSFNKLTSIPEEIEQLTQLQELYFNNNELTEVPGTIRQLTLLQKLYLHTNKLMNVPGVIGELVQLQMLDLSNNELMYLPESLKKLAVLRELYLHENEQLGLPEEILGSSMSLVREGEQPVDAHVILDYYFRAQSGRPLNEAKLILVGRGAVGKTSLVNRLVHNHFDRNEEKTEGIQITEWKRLLNGNEDIRLNVWDFGGQEIMHATHQFFLTQRSLYLLVLNGREGGEDAHAEYWLKLIESFGGDSPVIVVLTRSGSINSI